MLMIMMFCWWYSQAVVKGVHVQVFRQRAHTMALLLLTSHLPFSLSCFSFLEYIMAWMVYWCNFVGGGEKGKWDLSLEEDFVCCLVVWFFYRECELKTTKGNFHKDFIFVKCYIHKMIMDGIICVLYVIRVEKQSESKVVTSQHTKKRTTSKTELMMTLNLAAVPPLPLK